MFAAGEERSLYHSSQLYYLRVRPKASLSGALFVASLQDRLLAMPANIYTTPVGLARQKHSAYLALSRQLQRRKKCLIVTFVVVVKCEVNLYIHK